MDTLRYKEFQEDVQSRTVIRFSNEEGTYVF